VSCAEGCGEGWGHAVSCDARAFMRGLQVSGAFGNATRLHARAERMLYCWSARRSHAVLLGHSQNACCVHAVLLERAATPHAAGTCSALPCSAGVLCVTSTVRSPVPGSKASRCPAHTTISVRACVYISLDSLCFVRYNT